MFTLAAHQHQPTHKTCLSLLLGAKHLNLYRPYNLALDSEALEVAVGLQSCLGPLGGRDHNLFVRDIRHISSRKKSGNTGLAVAVNLNLTKSIDPCNLPRKLGARHSSDLDENPSDTQFILAAAAQISYFDALHQV